MPNNEQSPRASSRLRTQLPLKKTKRSIRDKQKTKELFKRYKETGDEQAREQLVLAHLNLARFLASKFKNRGESLDDLVQVATIGLIKAIDRFDISRGLEFTTFATPTIMGEIKRHFRDKGWSVRVPRRLQELSAKVTQVSDKLTEKLQRSPSVDEIAQALGVSVDEVLEAMESAHAYTSVSLDVPQGDDDDGTQSSTVIDKYALVDEDLESSDDRIVLEQAIKDFSEREQQIIRMRFWKALRRLRLRKSCRFLKFRYRVFCVKRCKSFKKSLIQIM